jgi:uncharacterized membrane protein YhaH (DUF805 family)
MKMLLSYSGRVNRVEFGLGQIISLAIFVACTFIFNTFTEDVRKPILAIMFIGLFVTNAFLTIKRCHDTDRSGWFGLLMLIPIVSLYAAYVLWFTPGTNGPNKYGEDPKSRGSIKS